MWTYLVGKSGNGGEGTLAMSPPPKGPHWTPTLFPGNATLPHVMSHFVTPWDDVTPHRDDTWSHMPHVTAWNSGQRGRQLSRCTWHMTPNPEGSQVGWFHTLTWADILLHTSHSTGMTQLRPRVTQYFPAAQPAGYLATFPCDSGPKAPTQGILCSKHEHLGTKP